MFNTKTIVGTRPASMLPKLVLTGASAAFVALLFAGCGQKGNLVLPTDPAALNRATLPQTLNPAATPAKAASAAR